VTIQLFAENLDKKDFFGKSDPYVVISKLTPSGAYTVVHRSEVIKNTLNPTWCRIDYTFFFFVVATKTPNKRG